METQKILDSKSVKGFIKGSLVLVGLFAILYCGVAVSVLNLGDKYKVSKNIETSKDSDGIYKNNEISKKIVIDRKYIIGKNIECNVFVLICGILVIPFIIFIFVFLFILFRLFNIVNKSDKSSDNKTKALCESCFIVAKAIKLDSENNVDIRDKIKEMLDNS